MRSLLLGLLFILTGSLNTQADTRLAEDFYRAESKIQLYMAYAEFKMANYATAHAMWQELHKRGKGEASFNLGILYEQGLGVLQNLEQARDYYLAAAESGSRSGAYQVGLMHMNHPNLVSSDLALHWLTIAALDGDTDAAALVQNIQSGNDQSDDPIIEIRRLIAKGQLASALTRLIALADATPPNIEAVTRLAWLYEAGLGVEQDIERAGKLFKQAAEAGNAEAQYSIAVMHETGLGRQQNSTKANHWLKQAAQQNYQPAIDKLSTSE